LRLKQYIQIVNLKKGEVIEYEDGICNKLVYINKGVIVSRQKYFHNVWYIFYNTPRLRRKIFYQAFVHDFDSYIEQTKTNINFQVATDCELVIIKHEDLNAFLKEYFYEEFDLKSFLSDVEIMRTKERIEDQLSFDFEQRYKRYKRLHPYLFNNVSMEDILCYLGMRSS
jgi:hypothetical protein